MAGIYVEGARRQERRFSVAGQVPTVPTVDNHKTAGWLDTDIYLGEIVVNIADGKVYTRTNSGIVDLTATGSVSGSITWGIIQNKPTNLVSSSAQINTGSFTGSFSGDGSRLHNISASALYYADPYIISNTQNVIIGNGQYSAAPYGFQLQATSGQGTNKTGGNVVIAGGQSTGNVIGGTIYFQTSPAGSSGASLNYLQTVMEITPTAQVKIYGHVSASGVTGSFKGDGSDITNIQWNNISSKPTNLVSSSNQVNTGSFTGSFAGTFTGNGSQLTGISKVGVYRDLWIDGGALVPATSSMMTSSYFPTSKLFLDYCKFTGSVNSSAQFKLALPDTYDYNANINVKIYFDVTPAAAGTVVFEMAGNRIKDNIVSSNLSTYSNFFNQPKTGSYTLSGNTTGSFQILTLTNVNIGSSTSKDILALFRIQRMATHASDNLASTVRVHGIKIQYKELTTEQGVWT